MINSIDIKNFRGIKKGNLKDFAKINLIVGGNNTGKSAIQEALYLATTSTVNSNLYDNKNNVNYEVLTSGSDYMGYHPVDRLRMKHACTGETMKKLNTWDSGQVKVSLKSSDSPFSYFDVSRREGDFLEKDIDKTSLVVMGPGEENISTGINDTVKKYMGEFLHIPVKLMKILDYFIHDEEKMAEVLKVIKNFNTADEVRHYLRKFEINYTESEPIAKYIETSWKDWKFSFLWDREMTYNYSGNGGFITRGLLPKHVIFYDVNLVFQYLPLAFYQEKLKEIIAWQKDICKYFAQILNLTEDTSLSFMPVNNEQASLQAYIGTSTSPAIPVDSFGDGARLVFKVIAPLISLIKEKKEGEEALFLWEEPELFQNPTTLYKLINTVIELIKEQNIQLFISTQSLEVVACFTELLINDRIKQGDIKTFQLNLKDGKLRSSDFTSENLITWLENGWDLRIWGGEFSSLLSQRIDLSDNEEVE